jgi:hypothetical protein
MNKYVYFPKDGNLIHVKSKKEFYNETSKGGIFEIFDNEPTINELDNSFWMYHSLTVGNITFEKIDESNL